MVPECFFNLFTSSYIHPDYSIDTLAFPAGSGGRPSSSMERHSPVPESGFQSPKAEISEPRIPRDLCTGFSLWVLYRRYWEVSNTVANPYMGFSFLTDRNTFAPT